MSTINLAQACPGFVTDTRSQLHAADATEMNPLLFDLNYGLPKTQLKLEFLIKILKEDGSGNSVGPHDVLLGLKWRFLNYEKTQLQFGMYPQVLVPTGERSRGLGEGAPRLCCHSLPKKLTKMDALRQRRLLVANCGRAEQLLLRRRGVRTRNQRAAEPWY